MVGSDFGGSLISYGKSRFRYRSVVAPSRCSRHPEMPLIIRSKASCKDCSGTDWGARRQERPGPARKSQRSHVVLRQRLPWRSERSLRGRVSHGTFDRHRPSRRVHHGDGRDPVSRLGSAHRDNRSGCSRSARRPVHCPNSFHFPGSTRYPSLPVRAGDRGLVYLFEGSRPAPVPNCGWRSIRAHSWKCKAGIYVPWVSERRPFLKFTHRIAELRKANPKGSTLERVAKEIGNSLYGKVAQGVTNMRGDCGSCGERRAISMLAKERWRISARARSPSHSSLPSSPAWLVPCCRRCWRAFPPY